MCRAGSCFVPAADSMVSIALSLSLFLSLDRTTVEGRFRCALDLSMFPFDAQPLMVEMQLGRCKNSGTQVSLLCIPTPTYLN